MKSISTIVACALLAHVSSIKISNDNDDVNRIGAPQINRYIESNADIGFFSRSQNEYDSDAEPTQIQTDIPESDEKKKEVDVQEHKTHKVGSNLDSNCHDQAEIDRQRYKDIFMPAEDIHNTLNGKCFGHGKTANDTQPASEPDRYLEQLKLEDKRQARSEKIANISYATGKPMNEVADELDNPKKKTAPKANATAVAQNASSTPEEKPTKEDKTKINPKPKEEEETLAQKLKATLAQKQKTQSLANSDYIEESQLGKTNDEFEGSDSYSDREYVQTQAKLASYVNLIKGTEDLMSMFSRDRVPYSPMQYRAVPAWRRQITDRDGDGIEDVRKMTYAKRDEYYNPLVFGDVGNIENTRNGALPGFDQWEFSKTLTNPILHWQDLVNEPWPQTWEKKVESHWWSKPEFAEVDEDGNPHDHPDNGYQ